MVAGMDTRQLPEDKFFHAHLAGEPTDAQFDAVGEWLKTAEVTIAFGSTRGNWYAIVDPNDDNMARAEMVNVAVDMLTRFGMRPTRLEPEVYEQMLLRPL